MKTIRLQYSPVANKELHTNEIGFKLIEKITKTNPQARNLIYYFHKNDSYSGPGFYRNIKINVIHVGKDNEEFYIDVLYMEIVNKKGDELN